MPDIFNAKQQKVPLEKTKNNFLAAFMVHPKGIHFETQQDNEEVFLLMRQHPITNLSWIMASLVLLCLPLLVGPIFFQINWSSLKLPTGYYLILPLLWYLGTTGYVFANFLTWYFNVYIVTNERIVDIDWYGLLYKQLSSTQINKVQDVTYKQGGVLDTFFDFGTVLIQTAGTDPNFEFERVPKPNQVVEQINHIIENQKNIPTNT